MLGSNPATWQPVNAQMTTIGNGDTIQNSTVYNNLQNTTIGNRDTMQNSTVYNLANSGVKTAYSKYPTTYAQAQQYVPVSQVKAVALQNTTIGNEDTFQNSTVYNNLQNTTIGNRDTMQNSTVYLQNTTIGNEDTFQNSTVYNLGTDVAVSGTYTSPVSTSSTSIPTTYIGNDDTTHNTTIFLI